MVKKLSWMCRRCDESHAAGVPSCWTPFRSDEPHLDSMSSYPSFILPHSPFLSLKLLSVSLFFLVPVFFRLLCVFLSFISCSTFILAWPLSLLLLLFFFCCFMTTPLYCVCHHQPGEPWKRHTNKVRRSISVSCGDTSYKWQDHKALLVFNHLCRGLAMGSSACVVCERLKYVCMCASSVGLAAARFTVDLVGLDNRIRE